MLSVALAGPGCRGAVRGSEPPELPSEALHYLVVKTRAAPDPSSISAREWARSRFGRLALWSVEPTQATSASWVVADLGHAAIADRLDVTQMLDAIELYREPLHLVVRSREPAPRDRPGGLDIPDHCSVRSIMARLHDLDCELAALRPLLAEDGVKSVAFYRPGLVRWK